MAANPQRNGVPAQPAGLRLVASPAYLASVLRPSTALYCVKNGLSAFLMSILARSRLHRRQVIVSSGTSAEQPCEQVYSTIERRHFTRVHPGMTFRALLERAGFWTDYCRGRTIYVYHTCSFEGPVKALAGVLFPPCRRVIVEHGTVELFRYLGECRAGSRDPRRVFLLSFHAEVMRYLRRQGIEPTLEAYPFPYPDEFAFTPSSEDREQALFAVQPLVDSDTLTADDCALVLRRFLARRPRRRYLIKPHPRACGQTMNVITRTLDDCGLCYQVMPEDEQILEKALPMLGCGEVCSFYSTASMLASRLYGIPYDTAVPELLKYATIRKQVQLDLVRTIAELFEMQVE